MALGLDFGTKSSSEKSQSYLPQQATWMKNLLELYGSQTGQGQTSYAGERVAGLSQTQQNLLGSLGNWSQYLKPTTGGQMYGQTGAALSDILAGEMGADPYTEQSINDLFKSAYEAPAQKQWQEYTKPEIQEAYSGPGYWSTARMQAVGKGAQDLGDTLSSQYGQLRYGAEESNKALQEAKAGRALSASRWRANTSPSLSSRPWRASRGRSRSMAWPPPSSSSSRPRSPRTWRSGPRARTSPIRRCSR